MQIDVCQNRTHYSSLWSSAQGWFHLLKFHVSRFEKLVYQVDESSIADFLRQDGLEFSLLNVVEEAFDVSLYHPIGSFSCCLHLDQCGVTAFSGPEPVRGVFEHWLIDGLQQEPYHFLHEFISYCRDAQRPGFPILFRNVYPAYRRRGVGFLFEFGNQFVHPLQVEPVYCSLVRSLSHVALFGVDVTVRQQIEVWIEQISIQSVKNKSTILGRLLTEHRENHFSFLHCAYLRNSFYRMTCFPSPCRRCYLPRTTTEAP